MRLLAQLDLGTFEGVGPLGTDLGVNAGNPYMAASGPIQKFVQLISNTLGILTVCAGLWFIFQIFGGALQWLGSGGEKQSLQSAQKRILNAIVGLLVVVLSYTIISIVGAILGFDILNLNQLIFSFAL